MIDARVGNEFSSSIKSFFAFIHSFIEEERGVMSHDGYEFSCERMSLVVCMKSRVISPSYFTHHHFASNQYYQSI